MMFRIRTLAVGLLLTSLATACGDDPPPPPLGVDGGPVRDANLDALTRDAAPPDLAGCADEDGDGFGAIACGGDDCEDANPGRFPGNPEICDGDDEDCNDATLGPDADGDGFAATVCCNGPGVCGTDCDDTRATINHTAIESCNMVDDDCDGAVDDAVCVACPAGYSGLDDLCTDDDECAMGQCGSAAGTVCKNTPGSYVCTCPSGYSAPATAGTCVDLDECVLGTCGPGSTGCVNSVGSFACSCGSRYTAPASGGACVDVNECTRGACGVGVATCVNTEGGYACTCNSGYAAPSSGGTCTDVDECAAGTPCGAGLGTCVNTAGAYACTCRAGYTAPVSGGACADVNECGGGAPCGAGLGTCANTQGSYACACNAGYTAPAAGGTCALVCGGPGQLCCVGGVCGAGYFCGSGSGGTPTCQAP